MNIESFEKTKTDLSPSGNNQIEAQWEVYYDGGFWNKNAKGKPCEEIVINKSFLWGDEIWHIPCVYFSEKGFVIDFCVELDPKKEKDFVDKWYPVLAKDENIGDELREQIEQENPMDVNFSSRLFVNCKELSWEHGCSVSYIPDFCLPEGVRNESEGEALLKHYGLDEEKCWSFHRCAYPRREKDEIKALKVKLEREPVSLQGVHFKNPAVGDVIAFVHPVYNTEHRLTVLGYEKQEFSVKGFQDGEYEYPTHHTAMTYTVEPDLSDLNFRVRDCLMNEQPKKKARNKLDPQPEYDACVAIIGGADASTAFMLSSGQSLKQHRAMSALRFEVTDDVEWKIVFKEKMIADTEKVLF